MTAIRTSQVAIVSLPQTGPSPIRVSQVAIVSLPQTAPPAIRCGQVAIVSVIGNGKRLLTLENVIALDCWQPCNSYGTYSTVVIFPN